MLTRIYPIYHNNKKIYYTNWSNIISTEEALAAIKETSDFILLQNEYDILEIIDVSNSFASIESLTELKRIAKLTSKFSKKKAIIGISSAKKILLNSVNRIAGTNIRAFDTVEEAKEWLTKEEK